MPGVALGLRPYFDSSIEGLIRALVPRGTRRASANHRGISELSAHIDSWPGTDGHLKQVAKNAVARTAETSVIQALRAIKDAGIVTRDQVAAWDRVRNQVMHGSLVSPYSSEEHDALLLSLAGLMHALTRHLTRPEASWAGHRSGAGVTPGPTEADAPLARQCENPEFPAAGGRPERLSQTHIDLRNLTISLDMFKDYVPPYSMRGFLDAMARRPSAFGFGRVGHGRGFMGGDGVPGGKKLSSPDLQLVILTLLEKQPAHGYELIRTIEQLSGGFYVPSPGVIYPALTYLEETGHAAVERVGSRKLYSVTEDGRLHLAANRATAEATLEALSRIGSRMDQVREAFAGGRTRL
jgi:DNA-binding PadR family transcriptional regulator